MKKHLYTFALILFAGALFTGCCQKKEQFGDAGKQAVRDTINMLMDKITGFASVGNADSTFQWLTNDSAAWFVTGGLAYSRPELLSMFKATFSDMQQQKIEPVKSQVLVFSPTSAAWICIAKDFVEMKDGKKIAQLLSETWLWQREAGGWKVVHYNESILQMPDESVKLQVEKGLAELAASLAGKTLTPAAMPAILTAFLQKHPFVYGSTLAFAPTDADGKLHVAAPYVYRSGNEFKQTDLPEAYDYTVSEWYSVPVKTKAPAWSNPYFDAGGGGVMMITYAIPMFDKEQKLIGVLTSDLEVRQ